MASFNEIKLSAERLAKDAKKSVNIKRNKMRIRNYYDEADAVFSEIGRIIYKNKQEIDFPGDIKLEELFKDIDNIAYRIKNIEKNMAAKEPVERTEGIIIKESPEKHKALNKKQEDLTIKRTGSGISFMRVCPKCGSDSPAHEKACEGCGHAFGSGGSS